MLKPIQLDFESLWADPAPPSPAPTADPLQAEADFRLRMDELGLMYDIFGGSIANYQCGSKSRLKMFPIRVVDHHAWLIHPDLADDPFLDGVEQKLGYRPIYGEVMQQRRHTGEWWHAVDLCSMTDYRELLDTLNFTTRRQVIEAVRFALRCGWGDRNGKNVITTAAAREILAAVGSEERAMASEAAMLERVEHQEWHYRGQEEATAWMHIHALEQGLVKRARDGNLVPTARRAA